MRKVIGIGETILDIIFRGEQPTAAVPGGSVFNGIVSLGRIGVPICFISETGNDHVGNIILNFMRENNIPTDHVNVFPDGKSPVSLAFLNNRSDAEYIFYKDYPKQRLDVEYPQIQEDDIVIIGSYYALNPVLRDKVVELLERAHDMHAIIYYDPNFRSSHKEEAIKLAPTIIENLEYANIVRGSQEDFFYMWGLQEADKIYKDKVKFYCRNFLCTAGAEQVSLRTGTISKEYSIPATRTSIPWTRLLGTKLSKTALSLPPRYARVSTTPFQRNLQKHENTSHRHPYKRVFTTDYMA